MNSFRGFAVSVPGNGHIRREIPCQDASGVWLAPRPCLIVCDGRGSARYSHYGAQAAVKAFRSQCAVMEDLLAAVLDGEKWNDNRWLRFCNLMIRTVCQQKKELAEQYQCSESEFCFTIAFASPASTTARDARICLPMECPSSSLQHKNRMGTL